MGSALAALVLLPLLAEPEPATAVADEITVTATRTEQRLGDTAASVVVLSSEELEATAAGTIDDALRQVPGFSLFRRSGSRFANPTTQGVSLRGLGASGASRALVLADGLPLNDPFGGWIYWGRVPRASLARIEVLRGAGSDLYGSAAMGGVVQLLTRPASQPALSLEASCGERKTPEASLFVARNHGPWAASLAAESFQTDGYIPIAPEARGSVDAPATSEHSTADLRLERGRIFLRGSWFDEERDNGTRLQVNDTTIRQASAGFHGASLIVRVWGSDQDYHQTFTAIAADRNSERLTREQRVPADSWGGSGQWSRAFGDRHALVTGLDLRKVRGTSDELVFGGPTPLRVKAGGSQNSAGLFIEDLLRLTPRVSLTLGGRIDGWRNEGREGDREETAFSPRASLLYRMTDRWAWTASAYRGFRAPTLNELYRAFRVGDVLTLANDSLRAERLTGVESGILSSGLLTVRGVLFWMEVEDSIANVTLSIAPGLITRQRRNLGRTRSRGLELEGSARISKRWTLSGGYLLSDATVESAPLKGLRIPQVPKHQASLLLRYFDPKLATIGLQARWIGDQFDDDLNQLPLDSFFTLDTLVSRSLTRGLEVFLAGENLLDEPYEIGRTPVRSLGPPRTVRVGVRFELTAPRS